MSFAFAVLPALLRVTEDEQFNPDTVTPGVIGFVITAVLALAVILLCMDLTRRLRRDRVRAEIRERLEAEQAEQVAADAAAAPVAAPKTDA